MNTNELKNVLSTTETAMQTPEVSAEISRIMEGVEKMLYSECWIDLILCDMNKKKIGDGTDDEKLRLAYSLASTKPENPLLKRFCAAYEDVYGKE